MSSPSLAGVLALVSFAVIASLASVADLFAAPSRRRMVRAARRLARVAARPRHAPPASGDVPDDGPAPEPPEGAGPFTTLPRPDGVIVIGTDGHVTVRRTVAAPGVSEEKRLIRRDGEHCEVSPVRLHPLAQAHFGHPYVPAARREAQ